MAGFRRLYGSNPLHLLAHVGVFFIAGWAIDQILRAGFAINWIAWFLGAALLHDLVLLPLYSTLDRGLQITAGSVAARRGAASDGGGSADGGVADRESAAGEQIGGESAASELVDGGSADGGGSVAGGVRRPSPLNHLRVPAAVSAILLLVYFPVILGYSSQNYRFDTGHALAGYTRNWLLICAGLFVGSALVYAARVLRSRPPVVPAADELPVD